ncbi:MAG: hypothetical protein JWR88_1483, partial [Pseudonocardia sp.]|nr:hypothetical protein [Pseudonocardia sp.]
MSDGGSAPDSLRDRAEALPFGVNPLGSDDDVLARPTVATTLLWWGKPDANSGYSCFGPCGLG